MSGNKILADTNTLIYLDKGATKVATLLHEKELCISYITEIELLGFHGLGKEKILRLENMLSSIDIIEMDIFIKKTAIRLKQKGKIKTPDAIIAATSLEYNIPLVTADTGFASIAGLNCIFFEV
ncbi:MAG: hypothetical protein POELPBGB_02670 [Bacteroidia bacterium]|nr:hypothetical protein [Bacteroidia bacterium]